MQTENKLGVVIKNMLPMWTVLDTKSYMVSQALMGQPVWIEKTEKDGYYVRTWDGYHGWVFDYGIRILQDGEKQYASVGPVALITGFIVNLLESASDDAPTITKLSMGIVLEVAQSDSEWVKLKLPDGSFGYIHSCDAVLKDANALVAAALPDYEKMIEIGKKLIGVPYVWSGTSAFGIDCSGFVQLLFHMFGITLFRDAHMQAGDFRCVHVEKKDLKPGDLVFFGKGKSPDLQGISHIGIAVDENHFIHSCRPFGVIIFDYKNPRYSGFYWGARRMISAEAHDMIWEEP